jgi:hypothetical protein
MITPALLSRSASVLTEDLDPDTRKTLIDNALPIAGLFVVVLGVALFLLWRSMSRQIKKIDPAIPAGRDDIEQARDRQLIAEAVERGETTDDAVDK